MKCAPRKAPCPTCGKLGNRKAIHHRRVRTIAYKQVVFLDITYGEYRTRCHCCTTFRTTPPGVEPRALYDNKVREAVLDRILEDGMSVERVIAAMGRDWDCENSRISGEIGLVETEKSVALFPDMEGLLFHGWSRTWQVTRRKG